MPFQHTLSGGACVPLHRLKAPQRSALPDLAGFAVVKLATDKSTGAEFAVKIMALPEPSYQPANDNENTREDIFKEIDILIGMDHENVLNLKEYYEEGGKVRLLHSKPAESSNSDAHQGQDGRFVCFCFPAY